MAKIAETQIVQRQRPRIVGKHVYGNMYEVEERFTANLDFLTKLVVDSAKIGNIIGKQYKVLDHGFIALVDYMGNDSSIVQAARVSYGAGIPGGVSVIALIEESHIALHTWPESSYATLDIYSCGEASNPELAFKYILSKLKPKSHKMFNADRSNI
ncbi:adenosylmethionine decarboxylase [Candidatus Marsarchaeota archaeon]|nr:adenosylmethionine decarboxylase [Candidatus Marsarchaeota archaeon]